MAITNTKELSQALARAAAVGGVEVNFASKMEIADAKKLAQTSDDAAHKLYTNTKNLSGRFLVSNSRSIVKPVTPAADQKNTQSNKPKF